MSTPICQTCTVFAIGVCADCGVPQCGNCGVHVRNAFLCRECRAAKITAQQVAESEAAEAATAAAVRAVAEREAAARRFEKVRSKWLAAMVSALDGTVRRNHREGWKVSNPRIEEVTTFSGSDNMYMHQSKRSEQLVLTRSGDVKLFFRSPGLWGRKWDQKVVPDDTALRAMTEFVLNRYRVRVDHVPSSN